MFDLLCALLDSPSVDTDSALWGWISRKRHYWFAGRTGGLKQVLPKLPTGFKMGWQTLNRRRGQNVAVASVEAQELKPPPPSTLRAGGVTTVFDPATLVRTGRNLASMRSPKKVGAQ